MSDIEKINIRRQMNEICEHNLNLYKLLNRKNNFIAHCQTDFMSVFFSKKTLLISWILESRSEGLSC